MSGDGEVLLKCRSDTQKVRLREASPTLLLGHRLDANLIISLALVRGLRILSRVQVFSFNRGKLARASAILEKFCSLCFHYDRNQKKPPLTGIQKCVWLPVIQVRGDPARTLKQPGQSDNPP